MVPCAGCLRAPIGDDLYGDGDHGSGDVPPTESTTDVDSSDASTEPAGDTEDPSGPCHPSYDPCLPIVGDLNCPDVEALGAAPVTVIGPDEYELDRDGDGIGCEL